jgi:hypothetical protein
MSRDSDLDRREKRYLYLRRLARKRIYLADEEVVTSVRYNTLFLGLKKNTSRNVALVHPIMFLSRRLIYALLIVALSSFMYTSVIVFMLITMVMLGYACYEH